MKGELRFEVLKANLHVYTDDREKLEADKENLLRALYSGYSRSLMFEEKSMTEREILVLYDELKPLKTKESRSRFKAVAKLREPIMNKLRKKYTDYVRRLFPAVMDDVVIGSSETSSSVVHASVGITGGLAKININDNCDDDNVNDEYDSDDNVVDGGGVDIEDCDAEDEDADDDDDEAQDEDDNKGKNETSGGKDVSGSVNEGRKRKNVDRLTTDPKLHAKRRASKKRFLSKSPTVRSEVASNDINFIYLDINEDVEVPDVPDVYVDEPIEFMKRIRREQYDDVIKVLKSHAVFATDAIRTP